MHERRVIFIEGLFGSGKSTMAELLSRELEGAVGTFGPGTSSPITANAIALIRLP
jgi:thymidylate kinase